MLLRSPNNWENLASSPTDMQHIPVLAPEILEGLNLHPGASVIDATLGLGGHTSFMLDITAPDGVVVGVDRDVRNLELAKERLKQYKDRVVYIHDSFANIGDHDLQSVDAVLFDLGFSSLHIDDASRGFSFQKEGPLDMRYDTMQELTAEGIVNSWPREELARLFRIYGEEERADDVAKAICKSRKTERFTTTTQLADLISTVISRRGKHPATKVFQALRIAVNDELGEIEKGIKAATGLLKPGGRIAVITFHSIEDRLVKQLFRENQHLEVLTKKVIKPSYQETRENPRARSSKLRIAKRI
jgi:16S rRNA (cytosine1402-N4)-methyltransferase